MKNIFKKIFLDSIYLQSFEQISLEEGFVSKRYDGKYPTEFIDYNYLNRNALKKRTLLLLTLFEEFDSDFTTLDLSRFINEGMVSEDALLIRDHERNSKRFSSPAISKSTHKDLILLCEKAVQTAFKVSKSTLISHHLRTCPPGFYTKSDFFQKSGAPLPAGFFWNDARNFDKLGLEKVYLKLVDHLMEHGDFSAEEELNPKIPTSFARFLWRIKFNFEECSYHAIANNAAFASGICKNSTATNKIELVDDLDYFVQTKLTDELRILPEPKCLIDVFKLRKKKEVVRLREILSIWCEALSKGDANLEFKIRKDIRKASDALRYLESWREYQKSQINLWINTLGGNIPALSQILSIVTVVGFFYERIAEKRNTWVNLIQPK